MKKINYNEINLYATARRFVIVINGLPINTSESRELVRGPITSAESKCHRRFFKIQKNFRYFQIKKKKH